MKTKEWSIEVIHEAYYSHSGNLSIVIRQLIYAEGAIVWILLSFYKLNNLPLSAFLFYILIFVFFILDLAHYWYLSTKYGAVADYMVDNGKTHIAINKAEPKYQEFFPSAKLIVALISSILFTIFLYNTVPMREILGFCN